MPCAIQDGCYSPDTCRAEGACHYTGTSLLGRDPLPRSVPRGPVADAMRASWCVPPPGDGTPPIADGGGLRFNSGKPLHELLPPEAIEALAWHFTQSGGPRQGPRKYPLRNWERGMAWLICFGAIMRHSWKWMRGEDFDPETGTHHMICVAWNACVLFAYHARGIGADDRPGLPSRAD